LIESAIDLAANIVVSTMFSDSSACLYASIAQANIFGTTAKVLVYLFNNSYEVYCIALDVSQNLFAISELSIICHNKISLDTSTLLNAFMKSSDAHRSFGSLSYFSVFIYSHNALFDI